MSSATYYLIGFVVVTFVSSVFGINCYVCSSYDDPDCLEIVPHTNSSFLQECAPKGNHQMFCRKIVQKIKDKPKFLRVTRSCGYLEYKNNHSSCQVTDNDFKMEISCQCFTDTCNAGNAQLPVLAPLILVFLCISVI